MAALEGPSNHRRHLVAFSLALIALETAPPESVSVYVKQPPRDSKLYTIRKLNQNASLSLNVFLNRMNAK